MRLLHLNRPSKSRRHRHGNAMMMEEEEGDVFHGSSVAFASSPSPSDSEEEEEERGPVDTAPTRPTLRYSWQWTLGSLLFSFPSFSPPPPSSPLFPTPEEEESVFALIEFSSKSHLASCTLLSGYHLVIPPCNL